MTLDNRVLSDVIKLVSLNLLLENGALYKEIICLYTV